MPVVYSLDSHLRGNDRGWLSLPKGRKGAGMTGENNKLTSTDHFNKILMNNSMFA